MKIVCDNCATKYSIADEKVRGKVFKIRCKKCSHIIVVRGGEGGVPQEAPGAGSDAAFPGDDGATLAARGSGAPAPLGAGDAVWHLVIDREQVGPLTPQEVRAKFAAGECDVETYAWREGFADWLRLGSIEDFRDLGAAAPAPAQAEEGATRRTDTADLFASSSASDDAGDSGGAADLFGGGGASAPAPAAAPMAAAPAPEAFSSSGGANLFGAPEEAPAPAPSRPARVSSPGFAASANGGAAAPAADSSGGRMTGQRNENSVLFSLNNLQALASGGGGGAAAAKPGVDTRPGFANSQTEGSGLIDIRAMAASTLAAAPATGGSAKAEDPVSFSAAPIFSPMAAPILMPAAPSGPPKWMWAILGVGVLAVIGIVTVGVLLLTRKPAETVVASNTPPPSTATTPAGTQPTTATPTGAQPTTAAPTGTQPTTPAAPAPDTKATAPAADTSAHAGKHHGGDKPAKAEKGTKVAKAESSPSAAPTPAPSAPEPTKKKKGGDALDDLLNQASPDSAPKSSPKRAAAREESSGGGDDNLPEQLTKSDIQGGMGKVRDRVSGCYGQYHVPGLANVQVTIAKSGRVSSANVTGTFAGTPTGSCVEKAVKAASFPPFKGASMSLTYPYVLR